MMKGSGSVQEIWQEQCGLCKEQRRSQHTNAQYDPFITNILNTFTTIAIPVNDIYYCRLQDQCVVCSGGESYVF